MEDCRLIKTSSTTSISRTQVGGHNPLIYLKDGRIAKPYSSNERFGYEVLIKEKSVITQYLAKYYGPYLLTEDNVFIPFVEDDPEYDSLCEQLSNNYMTNNETDFHDAENPFVHISYPNRYLMLSDATYNYRKPCLIDIKMGTRTYWHNASAEKVLRHTNVASRTTTGSLGIRICGLKLYQPFTQSWNLKGKIWGRSLKSEDMLYALGSFFYDGHNLRKNTIKEVLRQLLDIRDSIQQCYHRFYSSSLLIVYEGDDIDISSYNDNENDNDNDFSSDDTSDNGDTLSYHNFYCDTDFTYLKQYRKNNEDTYTLSPLPEEQQTSSNSLLNASTNTMNSTYSTALKSLESSPLLLYKDPLLTNNMVPICGSTTSLASLDSSTPNLLVPPCTPLTENDSSNNLLYTHTNAYMNINTMTVVPTVSQPRVNFIDLGNCNFTTKYDTPDDGYLFGINNLIAYFQTLLEIQLNATIIEKFHF